MGVLYGKENKKKKGQDINYGDPTSTPDNASHVIPSYADKVVAACGLRHVAFFMSLWH
jgi:hypothetical protein